MCLSADPRPTSGPSIFQSVFGPFQPESLVRKTIYRIAYMQCFMYFQKKCDQIMGNAQEEMIDYHVAAKQRFSVLFQVIPQ